MPKEIVHVPGYSDAIQKAGVPLSAAVKANGFVFVSGMPPMNLETAEPIQGDIETQTVAVMEALKQVLERSGSSLDKVVKVTVFAANAGFFGRINAVYQRYFPTDPPARSFVTVGSWPLEFDVEIECVAMCD
jgi:2-iminobutanoate/2-iminopropanoate deaminase